MSPEDKLKRAAIFKKMALRDKLEASRKRQSLGVLRDELSKNQGVRDQLEMVANRCTHLDKEVQTMQTELARAEQKRAKKQERAEELTSQAKKAAQAKADERLAE